MEMQKKEKVCTFFGHADSPTNIKKEIKKVIDDYKKVSPRFMSGQMETLTEWFKVC